MERKISQNQIFIKICCVVVSFIIWLYVFNVQNPVRQRKIDVPVKIVNKGELSKSNLVQVDGGDLQVSLEIKGNASDVFSVKPQDFKLECDIGSYVVKKGENNVPVKIKKQPGNVSVVNNQNLWISINLDSIARKTLPIQLVVEGQTSEGLSAVNPSISVKSAQISGAAEDIDNVQRVVAHYNVKNIKDSAEVYIKLKAEDSSGNNLNNIDINPEQVKAIIPLGKVKSVPIGVKIGKEPEGDFVIESITSYPDRVYISGDEKIISKVSSINTQPVDLSSISSSGSIKALLNIPPGVSIADGSSYVTVKVNLKDGGKSDNVLEKNFNVAIKPLNLNKEYSAQMENQNVYIIVSGNADAVKKLQTDNIECYVDLSSANEGMGDFTVNVKLPEGVSLISKNPGSVKIDIKKISEDKDAN